MQNKAEVVFSNSIKQKSCGDGRCDIVEFLRYTCEFEDVREKERMCFTKPDIVNQIMVPKNKQEKQFFLKVSKINVSKTTRSISSIISIMDFLASRLSQSYLKRSRINNIQLKDVIRDIVMLTIMTYHYQTLFSDSGYLIMRQGINVTIIRIVVTFVLVISIIFWREVFHRFCYMPSIFSEF